MNLGLEEQRLPAGVHWYPCTGSCLALTCVAAGRLQSPATVPQTPVPAHKPLVSNSLDMWELWASASACGGSGEGLDLPGRSSSTGRHVQLNILPFLAPRGRRGWKKFYAVLKGTVLYLQKVTVWASPLCCLLLSPKQSCRAESMS